MSVESEFPDVAAQDLINPFIEGFLEKKRPSKYLSVKYQKRWCVIHEHVFYYFDRNTDKKQKGAFSLDGYTFFEHENLTFDLRCYGKRTFEFIAPNAEDMKRWRKAVKQASVYKSGPKEKKALGSRLPEPPRDREPSEQTRSGSPFTQNNWRQQSEPASRRVKSKRPPHGQGAAHPRQPQPPRTTNHRSHRRPAPTPENVNSDRQSLDEDNYIKVLRGQSVPEKPCRFSPSLERARAAKSEKRFNEPRKANNLNAFSNQDYPEESENKPEDLYLELIGDDAGTSGNNKDDPKEENFQSNNFHNEPIYENTNNNAQKASTLPAKFDKMKIKDMYATVNKQQAYYSESESEDSSLSDTEDYENACMGY